MEPDKNKRKAFTLIELAVVLTVIGLLIGGILASVSVINTSKINGMMRDISQYDTAVTNYRAKYGYYPGIYSFSSNGTMTTANPAAGYVTSTTIIRFWTDLSKSEGIKNVRGNDYNVMSTSLIPTELEAPRFNIDQYIGTSADHPPVLLPYGSGNNMSYAYINYSLANANNQTGTFFTGQTYNPLKAATALAFDKKFDDGRANSGNITGASASGGGNCNSGAIYQVWAGDTYACSISIRFGISGAGIQ